MPKSQLCACSFQESLRQKNRALEQIRKFPDTIGYVWTAENDSNTLRVDAKIFASAKKNLRKKKFPDTCGHGLKMKLTGPKFFSKTNLHQILWQTLFTVVFSYFFVRMEVSITLHNNCVIFSCACIDL